MRRSIAVLLAAAVFLSLSATSSLAARVNLRISPRSLDFGAQIVDTDPTTSTTLELVVKNKNRNDVFIGQWAVSGDIDAFSINSAITDPDLCLGQTLSQRETCKVFVTFDPDSAGAKSATVEVTESTFGTTAKAALSGVAVATG